MSVRLPDETELRSRIVEHLRARPQNPMVAASWHGYIAGLLEWGVIDANIHSRLADLLPTSGSIETCEILAGPDYVDEHPELREGVGQPEVAQ